jgi:hypothetical protein
MSTHPLMRPSDRVAVVAVLNPLSATTVQSTGWFNMSLYENALAILDLGVIATNGTVDAKFQQATDSNGTGVKDITGKSVTQLTQAGTNSNNQALINLSAPDMDTNGGFNWARLTITPATAAALIQAIVLGFDAKFPVVHPATVVQVV